MQSATLGQVELAYDTAGDAGTPVLLIMGFAVRGTAWRRQIPALAAHHQVVWFDNRGVGDTVAPRRPISIRAFADDAAAQLDHLQIERAHVVGISMGGMIAQHLALRHADRLRSLTLIATHAGGRRAVLPTARGLRLFLQANLDRHQRGDAVLHLLMTPEFLERADRSRVKADLAEELGTRSTLARFGQLGAVLTHNTRRRLSALGHVPTLVIKPERDVLIHPRHSDHLAARIPGARLVAVPDAGHGLLREHPEQISDLLLQHFAEADAAV
ncbi:MAG: alpha/beta fold hydrolase [bacterium]